MADITLHKPAPGQVITLVPQADDRLYFEFEADSASLTRDANTLVMNFDNGSCLVLTNFYEAYTLENWATFLSQGPEGAERDFFTALHENLMPTTGSFVEHEQESIIFDTIIGNDAREILYGQGDHDLYAEDDLYAGLGDDILYGSLSADLLDGSEGDDIFFAGNGGGLFGDVGDDILFLHDVAAMEMDDVLDVDGGAGMDVLLAGVTTRAQLENIFSQNGSNLSSMEVIMLGNDADAAKELQQSILTDDNGNIDEQALVDLGWTAKADTTVASTTFKEFSKMDEGQEVVILVQKHMDTLGY